MVDVRPRRAGLAGALRRLLPQPDDAAAPLRPIRLRRFAGPDAYLDQLDPIRIAHLTDQHVGRVTPMAVQRAATALANEQAPDLVLLTGDFVCHSQLYLDQLEEIIRSFRAPTFAVLGNHDHWSGADEVKSALRRGGAEVLCNAHTVITIRHQPIQIVGLDDAYTGHARREEAVRGLRHGLPSIGMSHIAEEADGLWRHGVPLVLSGHTHAGQVTLARLHELSMGRIAGHRYIHGLYGTRRGSAPGQGAVYVGAGIGASVIPLRLGDRGQREVAIFELGSSAGSFDEHHAEQPAHRGRRPSPEALAKRAAKVAKNREKRLRQAG